MIPFSCKTLWKVEQIFLKDEKIVFTLNYLFIVGSFFDAEDSAHDSIDGVARVLAKEDADVRFTFKSDALIDSEEICRVK